MQTDSVLARTANKMFETQDQEREYKEKAELYDRLDILERKDMKENVKWGKLTVAARRKLRKKWRENIEYRKKKTEKASCIFW